MWDDRPESERGLVSGGKGWLPVVLMQSRMLTLARAAADTGEPLPKNYHRLFRRWFVFGFPAFAVLAIFWLMITRPAITLSAPVTADAAS